MTRFCLAVVCLSLSGCAYIMGPEILRARILSSCYAWENGRYVRLPSPPVGCKERIADYEAAYEEEW